MFEQLRASVFVSGPNGEEVQVDGEIPMIVASDPGAVNIAFGDATVTFSDRRELITLLTR